MSEATFYRLLKTAFDGQVLYKSKVDETWEDSQKGGQND